MAQVKRRRARAASTRISSKHQVTIPAETLREAGLQVGERLRARVDGPGRVVLEREEDILAKYSGSLTGVYPPDAIARLREEWD